ncbi:cilia- and flagella-associated protein 100 isoform X2 [Esox lucius]|uniref:cilia- and flagella-associated protein 100 isoform X2 n=1 Tax=Esox lucius TaxID=8010 RepID=UPI001477196B|nr:cilia- and flagella-associated protein 100 isoform X2 [Esox lucius]
MDNAWQKVRNSSDANREAINPFVLPRDYEIFRKRETDSVIKQQENMFFNSLPAERKSTYLSRLWCRSAPLRRAVEDDILETGKCKRNKTTSASVVKKGCIPKRENIRTYVAKHQEMFMLQYSLAVKRDTMKKLEKDTVTELQKINKAEEHLKRDSVTFEKFIKENDQSSAEAVKLAEMETMKKLEKTAEIKKVTAEIMAMKSEMSKYQEILKDSQTFRTFLTAVAPVEWREEQIRKKEERKASKQNKDENLFCVPSSTKVIREEHKKYPATERCNSRVTKHPQIRLQSKSSGHFRVDSYSGKANGVLNYLEKQLTNHDVANSAEASDSDHEPELCFSSPQDLVNLLTGLEEQNLRYIQNFQETEEAMDEICKTVKLTQDKMNRETQHLAQQIDILKNTILREEEKISELELKSRIFSYGEYRADKQDTMLSVLHKKVKEVYKACVNEVDSYTSTLHMLAGIEKKMEEITDRLEFLPPGKVDAIRSQREKEIRLKIREENMLLTKRNQEERVRQALERATSDSKRQTGRKLMPRSMPSEIRKEDKMHILTTRAQEDALHFFA